MTSIKKITWKTSRRWDIKTGLKSIGWGKSVDWIKQARERDKWLALVNIKCGEYPE